MLLLQTISFLRRESITIIDHSRKQICFNQSCIEKIRLPLAAVTDNVNNNLNLANQIGNVLGNIGKHTWVVKTIY